MEFWKNPIVIARSYAANYVSIRHIYYVFSDSIQEIMKEIYTKFNEPNYHLLLQSHPWFFVFLQKKYVGAATCQTAVNPESKIVMALNLY